MRDSQLSSLLLRYRSAGDVRALGELFDSVSDELLRVARHVASDEAEAEDLVQATFLTVMEHPERFDESRPLTGWLVGILTKEALSWRRQAARTPDVERVRAPLEDRELRERPDAHAASKESESLLLAALERLPRIYREVLEPHLRRGCSPGEIARQQATSPATIRVRLHRGMAQLRQLVPAGLAGGLALTLPSRGLAAMRAEIVSHANLVTAGKVGVSASVTATTLKLGSLVLVQRIGLGVACLALLYLAVQRFALDANEESRLASSSDIIVLSEPGRDVNSGKATPERTRSASREEARLQPAFSVDELNAQLSTLEIRTEFADGTPAPHIGVTYLSFEQDSRARRTRTDENGVARVEGLPPGHYALYGDRGGHATAQVLDARVDEQSTESIPADLADLLLSRVTLRLEPGVDVHGTVVDRDNQPVANAAIWITSGLSRDSGLEVARSDARGRFLVKQLTSACFVGARSDSLAPSKPEHVQYWLERTEDPARIELTLELGVPAAEISGVVLDPTGQPLEGARVRVGAQAFFDTFGPTGAEGPPPPIEVRTDVRGEFSSGGLEPGNVEVACIAEGLPASTARVLVDPGGRGRVELRMQAPAYVSGRVIATNGSPLARVSVRAHQRALNSMEARSSFDQPECTTNAQGEYRLGPLAGGEVRLTAETPDRKHRAGSTLQAVPGGEYQWSPTLSGLPTIRGRALDRNGGPLAGWTVIARCREPLGPPPTIATTEADGQFELTVAGEALFDLELHAPEEFGENGRRWVRARAPQTWLDDVATGSTEVLLQLEESREPNSVLTGTLVGVNGTPKLLITAVHERFREVAQLELPAGSTRFELTGLPAGSLDIRLESTGFAPVWRRAIQLARNEVQDIGALSIEPGADLRLVLRRENGALAERVDLQLTDSQGIQWHAVRNGEAYTRDNLPAGEYTVFVQAEDCGPHRESFTLLAGERNEIPLNLPPGGSIGFVILTAKDRAPEVETTLRISTASGEPLLEETFFPGAREQMGRWIFAPHGTLVATVECLDGKGVRQEILFQQGDGSSTPRILRVE